MAQPSVKAPSGKWIERIVHLEEQIATLGDTLGATIEQLAPLFQSISMRRDTETNPKMETAVAQADAVLKTDILNLKVRLERAQERQIEEKIVKRMRTESAITGFCT